MARRVKFERDSKGIREMLLSMGPQVEAVARQIAANVNEPDYPVEVRTYTTDRAAAAVSIAHPAGQRIQAKRGSLTRAAAAAGYEVRS